MKRHDTTNNTTTTAVVATVLTAALLLASCSKEGGEVRPPVVGEPAQLGVSVTVAPQTRSVVTGTSFSHGSQIGVILLDAGATTTYPNATMPYQFSKPTDDAPGVWLSTQPTGLLVSDPADVLAYSPATLPDGVATLSTDKKNLEIALPATLDFGTLSESTTYESFWMKLKADAEPTEIFVCRDDVDFLTGKGTQVSTEATGTKETSIAMKHAMAMVVVYVKRHAALPDHPDVKEIVIRNTTGATPLTQGSFALSDNTFTPTATPASYTRTMSGFPVDMVRYAMLTYPATMTAGAVEMVLTADQATYTMPMPAKEWKSGWVYVYNVEISANEAQIGTVTLTEWPEWVDKPLILD